ncbi:phosphoglycerate kinase [Candidatus Saccharibacteria bacterium]|nr:MAG: phosphoglycerate kinase [Candidatus Saccharibacteria bacterium]
MSFHKRTIRDYDIANKRVLLRVDYNVPLQGGAIVSDYRIRRTLPTLRYLLQRGCSVVVCSHLGRPDGRRLEELSLRPVAKRLSELLGRDVRFSPDCVGSAAEQLAGQLQPGDVLLLENLRFHPQEMANDDAFGRQLARLADVFVQDGFGVAHRVHASTDAVTRHLPAVAGLLLVEEMNATAQVVDRPRRPLMAVIGGAKISDKLGVLKHFVSTADSVAIGGAMANTFLLAEGVGVGKSLVAQDELPLARDILRRARERSRREGFVIYIPQDGVVATSLDETARIRTVDWGVRVATGTQHSIQLPRPVDLVAEDEMILDIGPLSAAFIAGTMQLANTVVWNGTMGMTEVRGLRGSGNSFTRGTDTIVDAMLGKYGRKPFTFAGGGDTSGYLEARGLVDDFDHVSTGGGASMELISGKKLPGVEALL